MITLNQLSRRYGDFLAVDTVSFTIERGEVVGLLGHNGAGKTTIMKMLTGFLEPSSGSIQVDQLEMGRDTAAIQKRVGYLPENCPAWPDMTVIEFLEYQAALHDIPNTQRTRAIAQAIRRTELKEKATQLIQTLSRGYRQRLGVAQAILHTPDIIILDEPTNGLDPTQILHMRSLIRELAQSATVIVSTHILQEVQAVCERVLILRSGRKIVDAKLAELQRHAHLTITVDQPSTTVQTALAGILQIDAITLLEQRDGQYRYTLSADSTLAPRISAALQQAGCALYELVHVQRTLETVFAEVNAASEVHDAA